MLRSSLKLLIEQSLSAETIQARLGYKLLEMLKDENHHKQMRMELMALIFPTRMNTDPHTDSSGDICSVVDRVRTFFELFYF